jgi:transposase
MGHLSVDSKHAIVQKALGRNGRTLKELAQSHNIGYSTLQKWIRHYRNNVKITPTAQKTNKALSQAEKFQHLMATGSLNDVEVGVYCREQGIYSFELKQWKENFMTQKSIEKKDSELAELKLLRAENKELKREIQRKDRALAETTALLVLKKKAALIWGEAEDG